ncbi:MAG: hypothetical protein Ct9H300mP4_03400 [Gammaproteobacteria bacterium]|nr:MAG: hypothetical protein Ct9H300mP4_03400 [Gammaproteobacteria bacterium]
MEQTETLKNSISWKCKHTWKRLLLILYGVYWDAQKEILEPSTFFKLQESMVFFCISI